MDQNFVSVVMAAYNCESYVEQAIASALGQTGVNLEVIVVDDGSRDDTLAVTRKCAERDSRVRVFTQPPSGKPGVARNAGLRHATGQYVCFLDSDDWYAPARVSRCLAVFQQVPDASVVFHDMWYADAAGNPLSESFLADAGFLSKARVHLVDLGDGLHRCRDTFYEFMSTHYAAIHTNSVMIRLDALRRFQTMFAEDVSIGEDLDLWFRLALSAKMVYLDEKLSFYRQHDAAITGNRERWFRDSLTVHTRNYERGHKTLSRHGSRQYRWRIASMLLSQGYMYWTQGKFADARDSYSRSFRWSPNAKTLGAQIKALLPEYAIRAIKRSQREPLR